MAAFALVPSEARACEYILDSERFVVPVVQTFDQHGIDSELDGSM